MYIEASSWSLGDNAKLQLAVPRSSTSYSCLIFYYHMYGYTMGTLNVFDGNDKIFTKSGNQGFYWKKVSRLLYLSDVVNMIDINFYTNQNTGKLLYTRRYFTQPSHRERTRICHHEIFQLSLLFPVISSLYFIFVHSRLKARLYTTIIIFIEGTRKGS